MLMHRCKSQVGAELLAALVTSNCKTTHGVVNVVGKTCTPPSNDKCSYIQYISWAVPKIYFSIAFSLLCVMLIHPEFFFAVSLRF